MFRKAKKRQDPPARVGETGEDQRRSRTNTAEKNKEASKEREEHESAHILSIKWPAGGKKTPKRRDLRKETYEVSESAPPAPFVSSGAKRVTVTSCPSLIVVVAKNDWCGVELDLGAADSVEVVDGVEVVG